MNLNNVVKCQLVPHTIKEVVSMQETGQQIGWQISSFNIPEVWNVTRGDGVKIAVLDSGIIQHPDLKDNLLPGVNFDQRGSPPIDDNGHATACTGIICAENNDIGMVGVACNAKVMPVKVLDGSGCGDLQDVADGIRWAVDNGTDIISMSLGCPNPIKVVEDACNYAVDRGVIIFCAAGNAGATDEVFYPARYPTTISIGAIDKNFNRASFSNTGHRLDFMAPGLDIFCTYLDNWYTFLSGTSQAAPYAAGIGALLLSYARATGKTQLKNPEDYRQEMSKYTTHIAGDHDKFFEGMGIIDMRKFMESLKILADL